MQGPDDESPRRPHGYARRTVSDLTLPCKHCNLFEADHAARACLFMPTAYTPYSVEELKRICSAHNSTAIRFYDVMRISYSALHSCSPGTGVVLVSPLCGWWVDLRGSAT